MKLEISSVTKRFQDVAAVDGLSYTFGAGVYGLLGVNGAGKTTLMRMICTLLTPTEGTLTWDGEDIFGMDGEYRKILGYLPQDFGFYPDFTVYDYLLYIGSIKGLRPLTARARAGELIKQMGLEKVKNKKMKKLSGGTKRRAGIAQAMLNNPEILILDEPTAGLDPSERIRFRNLISELAQERLVLLSTHIVLDIEYVANDILLMKDGGLVTSGTVTELTESITEKVWTLETERKEADSYMKRYKVSNVKTVPGGVSLRVLAAEKPSENAALDEATLEDVFLHYFGEKAGGEDA